MATSHYLRDVLLTTSIVCDCRRTSSDMCMR